MSDWATSAITWCAPSSLPVTTMPRTAVVHERLAVIVGLGDEGVHPFPHASTTLDGWPSHVGVAMTRISALRTSGRISGHLVAVALVVAHTWLHVVIGEAHDIDLDVVSSQGIGDDVQERVGVRPLGAGFQVQFKKSHACLGRYPDEAGGTVDELAG